MVSKIQLKIIIDYFFQIGTFMQNQQPRRVQTSNAPSAASSQSQNGASTNLNQRQLSTSHLNAIRRTNFSQNLSTRPQAGLSQHQEMRADMKKLYEQALQLQTKKMSLVEKLKSNERSLLIKYMKKLELPSPDESMSTEGILDSICTFLVTNEGKRKAALSMQEATYEKLYIQPGGQNSSQKRQEPNLPAQQAAYPFPPVAQQVLPSITNLQQQRVVQQVFNRTPDQPLPVAQESMRNQTSPPKLPEIPQSAQNNSLQPGDASFKDNSSPTLSRQPQESPIAQKEKPNCEIISSESNKEGACLTQPKLMPKIDPQKIIVPEQERVDTNIKRRISEILKVCTSPTMFSIPYDAIEFQRQSSRLCYFDIKERYINPLQSDPIQAKIMCVCSHPFVFKANMLACTFCQFLSHRQEINQSNCLQRMHVSKLKNGQLCLRIMLTSPN
ncbi:hypothetical protein FGO68_gene11985 [Halteria grandinella]|uniref:Uncharacterized protein n=1 Tax=Halteria grandinella TaxID=5974 RepID=A0A8J8P3I2_HALGN|nr:hypothetical protein FGO68_gene11985 [Halteria grandinella]